MKKTILFLILVIFSSILIGCETDYETNEPTETIDQNKLNCEQGIHNYYKKNVIDSTCTEEGLIEYVCYWCKTTKEEIIEIKPHQIGEWVYGNSENSYINHRTCKNCNYTEYKNGGQIFFVNIKDNYSLYDYHKLDLYILIGTETIDELGSVENYSWNLTNNSALASIEYINTPGEEGLYIKCGTTGLCEVEIIYEDDIKLCVSEKITLYFGNSTNISLSFYDNNENLICVTENNRLNDYIDFPDAPNIDGKIFAGWLNEDGEISTKQKVDLKHKSYIAIYTSNTTYTPGLIFTLNEDESSYSVTGYNGYEKEITIPGIYEGKVVNKIGKKAFENSTITKINLSDTIGIIENAAFVSSNIKKITITENLTRIEINAFASSALEKVDFVENCRIKYLGPGAFYMCNNLETILIPKTVTEIDYSCFDYCDNLSLILFQTDDISNIKLDPEWKNYKTNYYTNVKEVVNNGQYLYFIENDDTAGIIKYIGYPVNNIVINEVDGYIIDTLCENAFSEAKISSLYIGKNVKKIGESCFSNCSSLKSVKFDTESNIKKIEDYAFYFCDALTFVLFPDSLESISSSAFSGCSNCIYLFEGESINPSLQNSIDQNCEHYCNVMDFGNTDEYSYIVTNDGYATIIEILKITSKTLTIKEVNGYPVSRITKTLFRYKNVESITFGKDVTTIDDYAFFENSFIKNVTFEKDSKLQSLGERAFEKCYNLEYIYLPKSLQEIGTGCFNNCTEVTILLETENIDNILGNNQLPKGKYCLNVKEIKQNNNYKYLLKTDGTVTILKVINLPTKNITLDTIDGYSVTEIYSQAFFGTSVEYIIFGKDVIKIHDKAFTNCFSLKGVSFNKNSKIQSIGKDAFQNCKSMKYIYLPAAIERLEESCFYLAEKLNIYIEKDTLTNVYLGTNWNYGINNMYFNIKELTTIDSITYYVSDEDVGLIHVKNTSNDIIIDEINGHTITKIAENAFFESSVKNLTIGENITTISDRSFYNCDNLEKVIFENNSNLKTLGMYAFSNCDNLKYILLPESLTTVGDYCFAESLNLTILFKNSDTTNISLGKKWNYNSGEYDFDVTGIIENEDYLYYLSNKNYIGLLGSKNSEYNEITIDKINNIPVYYLGNSLFSESNVKTINIGDTVEKIGNKTFYNCKSLENVNFGANTKIQSLGIETFSNCTNLNYLLIPETVNNIGKKCFANSTNLYILFKNKYSTSMSLGDDWNKNVFGHEFNIQKIEQNNNYIYTISNDGKAGILKVINLPSVNLNLIKIDGYEVNYIGNKVFSGSNIKSVILGKEITKIGNEAFSNCESLESVKIEKGCKLTSLGNRAFSNCDALKYIHLPKTVSEIGEYCFSVSNNLLVLFEAKTTVNIILKEYWNLGIKDYVLNVLEVIETSVGLVIIYNDL